MIKRTSKFSVFTFCIFLLFGCSENKIKNADMVHSFTFGMAGHDAFGFCRKIVPNFIAKYPNGVNPRRTCTNYQYYTCHVQHYCNGDKQCETDAANYWLKPWHDIKTGKLLDRVTATKEICEAEEKRNSVSKSENKK